MQQLPTLQQLVRQLQKIPYLASRNVYRVASFLLDADQRFIENLCTVMLDVRTAVKHCKTCFNWAEGVEFCTICSNQRRDQSRICVVETWHDLCALERAEQYNGLYHILGGSLSPLEGRGPDQLHIESLLRRIDESIKEIIFATNPTPEGETTANFIATKLANKNLNLIISRLASGMPTGSSLEYLDRITISKALTGRRPF